MPGEVPVGARQHPQLAETRLMLLTGAAGVGKTRLAMALASAVRPDYPGGVLLVELAAVVDAGMVTASVAAALEVAEELGRPPVDVLCAVLDNCERVADACAEMVATLLARCPGLRVVATSRVGLRVPGELTWRVPSIGN